jgi:flagellar basal body-associated protein FliL
MDEKTTPVTAITPVTRPSGQGRKIALVLIVVSAFGIGGSWWWLTRQTVSAAAAVPPPSESGLVRFEPFVVNLADGEGSRFLKIDVDLVLASDEQATRVLKTPVLVMQLRSLMLDVLTQQTSSVLITPAGKQALKAEIKSKVVPLLQDQKVVDVLFSDFVVQF